MQLFNLLENFEFHEDSAHAQPLYVDKDSRIFRFMLKPNQGIEEHSAPSSPFIAVVLKGHGYFAGPDGKEQRVGPNQLLLFGPDEQHTVRAGDEEFVFLGFLQGAPLVRPDHVGGELGREQN
jgi:quercetin dioxygenase-like cupin family protein